MLVVVLLVLVQLVGSSHQGTVYTRWGRTECGGDGDQLVYAGVVGGSMSDSSGGASNYLCLTGEPVWGNYDDSQNNGGQMYGAEYQVMDDDPFQLVNTSLNNQNIPCAVCKSFSASSSLMIPGTFVCTDGWQVAYDGYLMSQRAANDMSRTQYICVDSEPEVVPDGEAGDGGALAFAVEVQCGGLSCPPYVQGRELTCVVCTK